MDKADRRREALYDETDIGEITVRRSRKSIKAEGAACVQEAVTARSAEKEPAEQNQDEAVGFSIRRADTKRRENAKEQKTEVFESSAQGERFDIEQQQAAIEQQQAAIARQQAAIARQQAADGGLPFSVCQEEQKEEKGFYKSGAAEICLPESEEQPVSAAHPGVYADRRSVSAIGVSCAGGAAVFREGEPAVFAVSAPSHDGVIKYRVRNTLNGQTFRGSIEAERSDNYFELDFARCRLRAGHYELKLWVKGNVFNISFAVIPWSRSEHPSGILGAEITKESLLPVQEPENYIALMAAAGAGAVRLNANGILMGGDERAESMLACAAEYGMYTVLTAEADELAQIAATGGFGELYRKIKYSAERIGKMCSMWELKGGACEREQAAREDFADFQSGAGAKEDAIARCFICALEAADTAAAINGIKTEKSTAELFEAADIAEDYYLSDTERADGDAASESRSTASGSGKIAYWSGKTAAGAGYAKKYGQACGICEALTWAGDALRIFDGAEMFETEYPSLLSGMGVPLQPQPAFSVFAALAHNLGRARYIGRAELPVCSAAFSTGGDEVLLLWNRESTEVCLPVRLPTVVADICGGESCLVPQREGLYITVGPAPVMVHFGRIPQGLLRSAGARRTACRRMPEDSDGLFASVMVPSSGRGGVHGKPGLGENPVTLECCNFTKREVSAHISAQAKGAELRCQESISLRAGEVRKIPASLIVSSRDGLEVRIELRQEEMRF